MRIKNMHLNRITLKLERLSTIIADEFSSDELKLCEYYHNNMACLMSKRFLTLPLNRPSSHIINLNEISVQPTKTMTIFCRRSFPQEFTFRYLCI